MFWHDKASASKKRLNILHARKCAEQATITIRNNLNDISSFLKVNDVINYALYKEVADPKTRSTPDALAALVYVKLRGEVQGMMYFTTPTWTIVGINIPYIK